MPTKNTTVAKDNSTSFSNLWDNDPKLLQVLNQIDFSVITKINPNKAFKKSDIPQSETYFSELFAGLSPKQIKELFQQSTHWLNQAEVQFIVDSWNVREDRFLQLKKERDEALAAAEAAKALVHLPPTALMQLNEEMQAFKTAPIKAFTRELDRRLNNPKGDFYQATIAALGNAATYEILYENSLGQWIVKCGLLDGLPFHSAVARNIDIFENSVHKDTFIGRTKLDRPNINFSQLLLDQPFELEKDKVYQGIFLRFPASPAFVHLLASDEKGTGYLKTIIQFWDSSLNILYATSSKVSEKYTYEVIANTHKIIIRVRGKVLTKFNTDEEQLGTKIMDAIKIQVGQDRVRGMNNAYSKLQPLTGIDIGIIGKSFKETSYHPNEIKIYTTNFQCIDVSGGTKGIGITPNVAYQENGSAPAVYCLQLRSNASIVNLKLEQRNEDEKTIYKFKTPIGWGLESQETHGTLILKFIINTAASPPLPIQLLERAAVVQEIATRSVIEIPDWSPLIIGADWYAITKSITLINPLYEIGTTDLELIDHQCSIKAHPFLKAMVCLLPNKGINYSADPANQFSELSNPDFQLISFTDTDSNKFHFLEAVEITGNNTKELAKQPLEVLLYKDLAAGAQIIALAFDGQKFSIIGESSPSSSLVLLSEFPTPEPELLENGLVNNPFGEEPLDPSLFYALKIAFFIKKEGTPRSSYPKRPI